MSKLPRFGRILERMASPNGMSAEIRVRNYANGNEALFERWHEESIKVASAEEAKDVINRSMVALIDGGVAESASYVIGRNPRTHEVDKVVITHLVKRERA